MSADKSIAHRLGGVLEKVTRQSGRMPVAPEYGSWLLGKASESQLRRRVRIQLILTVVLLVANILGISTAGSSSSAACMPGRRRARSPIRRP